MINTIEKWGLWLRVAILTAFILLSVLCYLLYSGGSVSKNTKSNETHLALWPPDMVPHPPHFPGEKTKKPGESTPCLVG